MTITGDPHLDFVITFFVVIGCIVVVGCWGSAFAIGAVNEARRRQGRDEMSNLSERHIGVTFGFLSAIATFALGMHPFG